MWGECIAIRRPARRRAGRLANRSERPRRADVSAPRQDAVAGDAARPHDPSGSHRLYRPGEGDRSCGASKSAAELYPDIRVSELDVPSPLGRIRCQVFNPPDAAAGRAMMLYAHGGGFTLGQSEDTAYITSRIAAENSMVVVSVNYRFAPEWPFPACLDDCLEVLQWMQRHGATLGGDAARIAGRAIGGRQYRRGASPQGARRRAAGAAGGGAARPDHRLLLRRIPIVRTPAPLGIVYDTAFIGFIRGAYLVHGKNWAHPHASPMRADLRGYLATFIATGTADPLVDDNRAFARKLRAAGGMEVEHLVRDGMPHGFYFFPGMFKQGDEAFAAVATFLGRTGLA